MKRVDMSPEALTVRLRQVDDLRRLCLTLAGPRLRRPQGVSDQSADAPANSDERPQTPLPAPNVENVGQP